MAAKNNRIAFKDQNIKSAKKVKEAMKYVEDGAVSVVDEQSAAPLFV